jgi:hypothetical protein
MCIEATTALTIASAVGSVYSAQGTISAQKAQQTQQIRQNELARQNAIQRYASEGLKIRQIASETAQKGFEASKKAKSAQASFMTQAGDAGGIALSGSTEALMRDFERTKGNYDNSLTNNLKLNVNQFKRNLEAIQFGQEAQSTYVTPPNPEMAYATSALNIANSYYSLEAEKQMRGLQTNKQKSQQSQSVVDIWNK